MKTTLALLMAAAVTIGGFQAANAQNVPLSGYASNGSFLDNLLNGAGFNNGGYPYGAGVNYGYSPYLNGGYGNGGSCNKNHRKKSAWRKMQRRMARQAMYQNGGGWNNGYMNNGCQNAGNGRWGF